jgi:hypothetical protein
MALLKPAPGVLAYGDWVYQGRGLSGLGGDVKKVYILVHDQARAGAHRSIDEAPAGHMVTISEPTRNADQNAKFHAICTDLAKSKTPWAGKPRTADQWKVLLVSAHSKATAEEFEIVPGLEGEFVNIRESTALMSVRRSASLITYALAFCDMNGIVLSEPKTALAA